jgi:hypothetical protein
MILNTTTSSSIPRQHLCAGGLPDPAMVWIILYMWTITPGVLSSATLTFYWNDGTSNKQETYPLQLLLSTSQHTSFVARLGPYQSVEYSVDIVGSGTFGICAEYSGYG